MPFRNIYYHPYFARQIFINTCSLRVNYYGEICNHHLNEQVKIFENIFHFPSQSFSKIHVICNNYYYSTSVIT
jgi:hypothetical protein